MTMRFSINTLGCKVNLCESDELSDSLTRLGLKKVDYRDGGLQLCIINTCTVTAESDRKVRQLIRKIKKINKKARLVVTGCFIDDNMDFLKEKDVDLSLPNASKDNIPAMAGKILELINDGDIHPGDDDAFRAEVYSRHSRPIIKVQDGCEQHCAYCIIPIVRGGYRSIKKQEVLEKINGLVGQGFEEAVLTGIHIGKYGIEDGGKNKLHDLLEEVLSKTSIKRVRISSLEINEIGSNLLDVISENKNRIAPHLHIPLQSGSDSILKKMGRPYDSGYFRKGIRKIKKVLPDFTFTTDVMVGFPGETEKDFEKTLKSVADIRFSKLHVFRYSPRPGTRAFLLKDRIPGEVKNGRSKKLLELGNKLRDTFIGSNIGKTLAVAVERKDPDSNLISGTSGNYIRVYFTTELELEEIRGKIIGIRTESRFKEGLSGILVNKDEADNI